MNIDLHIMAKAASAVLLKDAGIADRPYMHEARGKAAKGIGSLFDKLKEQATVQNGLRYGLPAAFGGLAGAEQVPENRLLGAAGGAGGAVAGSELGGRAGRAIGAKSGPVGENIGELLGRLMGAGAGQSFGIRGAKVLAGGRGTGEQQSYPGAP